MSYKSTSGRENEIDEIVTLLRAAEVGRLMLGDLDRPMKWIGREQYLNKTRNEIKAQRSAIRDHLRDELSKFCKRNFVGVKPVQLAEIYKPLFERGGIWRLPLTEFVKLLGQPKEGVLRGTPLHSTVSLSPWELQTEYPEMHLVKDLAVAFNAIITIDEELKEYKGISWNKAKEQETRKYVADLIRRFAYHKRMCVLSCFNLAEAYINGLAWEYVQTNDISTLSNTKQKILTEGQASILDKLVKIPEIIKNSSPGPLTNDSEPLITFRDTIKPFRDSIVHASPFAAPERFGGYEKLSKIYDLSLETVRKTVEMTFEIIGLIHRFVGGQGLSPKWTLERKDDGTFVFDER